MKTITLLFGLGVVVTAMPAAAHDTQTAWPSRGACESASAAMSNAEKDWLLNTFPDIFASTGEVASFLTRAWTCDLNASDGQWYITDHRDQVLSSEWFQRREH